MRSREQVDAESQARARYAELVDKKFSASLTEPETAELSRLQAYLDQAEARFYEPVERKLDSILAKARRRSLPR